ncbi:MAG: HYR domain-containing protein [Saprospiraceae bacterium]
MLVNFTLNQNILRKKWAKSLKRLNVNRLSSILFFTFAIILGSNQDAMAWQGPVEVINNSNFEAAPLPPQIICETAPVISCPPIYYECPNGIYTPDVAGMATAVPGSANCPEPIVSYSDSIYSVGPCAGALEIQRMWTAVYPPGTNELLYADCTQLIFLADSDGPTISNCPQSTIVSPNENCEAVVTWQEPTATDICGLESLTSNYPSGYAFPMGMTTVIYIAVDLCGNETTCSFMVNVSGSCCFVPPVISCPENYLGCPLDDTTPTNTGMATATMGSTFCDDPVVTYNDVITNTGNCDASILIERTWMATYDENPELTSTCTQLISLEDDKAPLITNCPTDITLSPNNDCQAVASWDTPVATDNCGVSSFTVDIASGSTFEEGSTTVTYTAIDNCNNTKTCSFVVTVSSCCTTPPSITCPDDFEACPGTDITPISSNNCTGTPDAFTGWAVATCNADDANSGAVGVIYDTRNTPTSPEAADWSTSITSIHPANWTVDQIGQIFGIALGDNNDVYLAASDIYDTQYSSDPYNTGQIFIAKSNNGFLAEPFIDLPNSGGALNGIGNIVYDKINHQLFASNLEDGKIYRISAAGNIIDTYDPWSADNGSNGIVDPIEQVWAIGLNEEDGIQKLYFPRIDGTTRDMYAISLTNGAFPSSGSESIQFSNIMGVGQRISDIAFSTDGNSMVFAERGTKFLTGAHDSKTLKYTLANGTWSMNLKYNVGSWVTEQFPELVVNSGENSAGGVDFGAVNVSDGIDGCDQVVWSSMNYLRTDDGGLFYGIQGMNADGNNPSNAPNNPNTQTDIIIDFDAQYDNFIQKGDIGDVEIFKPAISILSAPTGIATATNAGNGCGDPIITFEDEIVSTGPCNGATTINRIWTATDSEHTELVSTCVQTISLTDTENPVLVNCPSDIDLTTTGTSAVATWTAPSGTDNCNLVSVSSDIQSGSNFDVGTTGVTYTATDECGNTITCTFTVNVVKICGDAPIITCPSAYDACISTSTDPSVTGTATAVPATPECGISVISYSDEAITTGPCTGAIKIKRTWTATDPDYSDLVSTCIQIIELADDIDPELFNCPVDITVTTPTSSAVVTWTEPTATDNCGIEWLMADHNPGDTFAVGTTTVTYTAVDNCDNVTPCSFVITVEQVCDQAPIITCPTNVLDCVGTSIDPSVTGTATAVAATEACDTPIITYNDITITSGPCAGAIKIKRTWIAKDPNNAALSSTCFQIIELKDDLAPVISNCPTDITVEATGDNTIVTWIEPTAIDDCHLEWIMGDYAPGDSFEIGTTTVTYTAADDCGNDTYCTFTITVEPTGTITCPDDITVNCTNGNGAEVTWELPIIDTNCAPCTPGQTISGFVYMGNLNGSSYYCSLGAATTDIASGIASTHGGYLATITNQEENNLLKNFLGNTCAYIGLNDIAEEGTFVWSNGETSAFTNWGSGQPNNYNNDQDCVVMNCGGGWNDEYCNVPHEYIMEIPCTSYIQTSGLANGSTFPVGVHTVSYEVTDQCGNQLECSFTVTVEDGASLNCPNDYTFSCGQDLTGVYAYWDTPELTSCCTDCSSSGDPINGFMYMGNYNGSNYYCSLQPELWINSKLQSESNGGYLVEINDAGENTFLANLLTIQRAWIGLNDIATEGVFVWANGNPLMYNNWYPGQPNNQYGNQDFVSLLSNGQWNDESAGLKYEYIMEIPCSNNVTQIGGPVSGSFMPMGTTTTITYAGMDGCGNTDTCSFDINILESECAPQGLETSYMWIDHMGIGDFNHTSGNNGGYADFTDICANVAQGSTYPIAFTPGFSSSVYNVYWKMWIDYNQDGDYNDAGEFVAYGTGYNQLTGNLPIPNTCNIGATTMRLAMKFGEYPTGPCDVFSHGEVEDYCINITGTGLKSNTNTSSIVGDAIQLTATNTNTALNIATELPTSDVTFLEEKRTANTTNEELIVYPNPVREILTLEMDTEASKKLYLIDNLGQLVKTFDIDFSIGRANIDISQIENGIYFLKSEDGNQHKKIVIQK